MAKVPLPDHFKPGDDWDTFRESFEIFMLANEMSQKADAVQVAALKAALGPDSRNTIKHLNLSEDNLKKVKPILDALGTYYKPKLNVVYERYKFNTLVQGPEDSIETYVRKLRELAQNCSFGALKEELLRDRLVLGCKDSNTRAQHFREPDLTLD